MFNSTNLVASPPPAATPTSSRSAQCADRAYRGLTVAFMLMLLASLWLFR